MTLNWNKEVLLITGGSSGLGKALAVEAGKRKASVILVARNSERLEEAAGEVRQHGGIAHVFSYDFSDLDNISTLYAQIRQETGLIPTILVNNAGFNACGFVANTPPDLFRRNFDVNLFAPVALIQCVLPDMVKNGWGCIVNVIGAANYHSFPANAAYSGTKVALQAMHESLQAELDALPIHTLMFNPGSMKTDYNRNRDVGDRLGDYSYVQHDGCKSTEGPAKAMFEAIETRRHELDCSSGLDRIGRYLAFFMPKLTDRLIVKRNQSLLKNHPFL